MGCSISRKRGKPVPVDAGPGESADVHSAPHDLAVLDNGTWSVMHRYTEIDRLSVAADPSLAKGVLRARGTPTSHHFAHCDRAGTWRVGDDRAPGSPVDRSSRRTANVQQTWSPLEAQPRSTRRRMRSQSGQLVTKLPIRYVTVTSLGIDARQRSLDAREPHGYGTKVLPAD